MADFKTEQEAFWAGAFGDEYVERNRGENWIASNTALFRQILSRTAGVGSVLEVGANIGLNLRAIRRLLPQVELTALEINEKAAAELEQWGDAETLTGSVLDFEPDRQWDFVFTKGVLIHLSPDHLPEVYRRLHEASARYVCVAEYYNPSPVTISYRGNRDRLFKRDFAGEMLEMFGLELVDYGFAYHRDPMWPQDDLTWFLLEKA